MKNLLLLFFSFAAISVSAQINVIKPQEKEEAKIEPKEMVQVYDSLMSLNSNNVMQHVGQTLFVRKTGNVGKNKGFEDCFFTQPPRNLSEAEKYIYKPMKEVKYTSTTAPDAVAGRYFLVIDVIEEKNNYIYNYCMKLSDVEKGDTLYFVFQHRYDYQTDIFLTVGYYEKLKQKYVGQEFYTKFETGLEKIDSEQKVKVPFKTKFKCVDLAVSLDQDMYAILENSKYGKLKCPIHEGESTYIYRLIPIADYNELAKRYGSYYTGLILRERVAIGMTESMVKASWGEPERINTTTGSFGVHEQWVYGSNSYVYFENGKVTAIQN